MALARTHSVALIGVTGQVVEVEADIANGLVGTILVGLPDTALREARDRIRAAIVNSGEEWPQRKITVGLSPASLPKRGSWFDLAVAAPFLGRLPEGGMSFAVWPGLVPGRSGRPGRTAVIGSCWKALGTVSDLGASRSAPTMRWTPEQ